MPKSPFKVYQEFLSPLQCENIVDSLNINYPDFDENGNVIPWLNLHNDNAELIIFNKMKALIPEIEEYFKVQYMASKEMLFEWYPAGAEGGFICENSEYINGTWTRLKSNDLSCMLFLMDYHDKEDFVGDWECYGGKMEFPQHQFGFNPQRGTLIIYPSGPHFLNKTTQILAGDLVQVRWHIATKSPYMYDPLQFPGDFRSWFNDVV